MIYRPSRREMIQSVFGALGSVGLGAIVGGQNARAAVPGHYAGARTGGKAKHVISLFLSGGPSQVDMFDPKPLLVKNAGQRPGSVDLRTERQTGGLMPSPPPQSHWTRSTAPRRSTRIRWSCCPWSPNGRATT